MHAQHPNQIPKIKIFDLTVRDMDGRDWVLGMCVCLCVCVCLYVDVDLWTQCKPKT